MAVNNSPNGPYVLQNNQHSAQVLRQMTASDVGAPGVVTIGTDMAVTQNGTPNMSVNVASGFAFVAGTNVVPTQGYYHVYNDATVNLTISASNPTNPRIDLVVLTIQDAVYSGSNNQALLQVITGTAAPSPVAPAAPASSLILAQVAVAANASSIVNANITDQRLPSGRPYLYSCKARYAAGTQTITASTGTTVNLDTKDRDPSGMIATGTPGVITIPRTGLYRVTFTAQLTGGGTGGVALFGTNLAPAVMKGLVWLPWVSGISGCASEECWLISGATLSGFVEQTSSASATLAYAVLCVTFVN